MELFIIQYSLGVVLGIYLYTLPFKIILILHDIPKTLWLNNLFKTWKK